MMQPPWSVGTTPRVRNTSRILPRRKEFVVQDLQEEIRLLKLRIDLLTKERDELRDKLVAEVIREVREEKEEG